MMWATGVRFTGLQNRACLDAQQGGIQLGLREHRCSSRFKLMIIFSIISILLYVQIWFTMLASLPVRLSLTCHNFSSDDLLLFSLFSCMSSRPAFPS